MNSRRKGQRGELEAAAEIRRLLGTAAGRGRQYHGSPDSPDIRTAITNVHFEVKRCERLSLYAALDQATRDAGENIPIVLHRSNRRPWVAIVRLEDLPRVAKELCQAQRIDE